MTLPYDEALHASWHVYFMSESEIEERDATLAGMWEHPDGLNTSYAETAQALDDLASEVDFWDTWEQITYIPRMTY